MNFETLIPADVIKDILPFEIKSRAKGKPIQVVSDFDETQASTYIFSGKWNTHVPKIRRDIFEEAQRLVNPMCLATARTSSEAVSWVMWHKLSRLPMPLVVENGAVLVWPSNKITLPAKTEVLASPEQSKILIQIQKELRDGLISKLKVPLGYEVVLRSGRTATVEIRVQEIKTKKGISNGYDELKEQLQNLFPQSMSQVEIISSGNSLGIQPIGVSKELGIRAALSWSGVKIDDVFLIGMGDNKNDKPLFNFVRQSGGLTIGVRPSVDSGCDFTFNGGDEVSMQILKTINSI
jgi:hydroxymethylpyrimidine pyrophosphatase-like HAD family hydrolase